jgi:hypothetical protein
LACAIATAVCATALPPSFERAGPQEHERRSERPDQVRCIDQRPVAHQLPGRDLPGGPGHDHEVVPGEQLGAAHHDQDQPKREGHAAEQTAGAEAQRIVGHDQGEEHGAERDEGAGEQPRVWTSGKVAFLTPTCSTRRAT